jgi:hypothetical protein
VPSVRLTNELKLLLGVNNALEINLLLETFAFLMFSLKYKSSTELVDHEPPELLDPI